MSNNKKQVLLNLEPEIREMLQLDADAEYMTLTQYIKYLIIQANKLRKKER